MTTREKYAAYLIDRADQYETESPCWVALADAARNIMNGDADAAAAHGEFDEELIARVRGFKRGSKRVDPKLGIGDGE